MKRMVQNIAAKNYYDRQFVQYPSIVNVVQNDGIYHEQLVPMASRCSQTFGVMSCLARMQRSKQTVRFRFPIQQTQNLNLKNKKNKV